MPAPFRFGDINPQNMPLPHAEFGHSSQTVLTSIGWVPLQKKSDSIGACPWGYRYKMLKTYQFKTHCKGHSQS